MSPRMKGALVGGIAGGLLSAIPFLNLGNCLCCLWIILGGAIASTVHVKTSATAVSKGDGTLTGVATALPMVAIYVIVGLPLSLLLGPAMLAVVSGLVDDPLVQQQLLQQTGQTMVQTVVQYVFYTVVFAVLAAGFGALGGLIGTAIFEDREPGGPPAGLGAPLAPPPPPPPAGGYPGQGPVYR
jgi:hypothetical protein